MLDLFYKGSRRARFKLVPADPRKHKNPMPHPSPPADPTPPAPLQDAAALLQALEILREELGSDADEIISALREAGVTPAPVSKGR